MKSDLIKAINNLKKIIQNLEDREIMGPIPYIEESMENLKQALNEFERY